MALIPLALILSTLANFYQVGASAINLIPDPLLNTPSSSTSTYPANWLEGRWGTNTETFTYNNSGYNDTNSVTVNMTSYSSGDAKWYFEPVTATPNTTYSFSDYYKASVPTDVVVQFQDSSGNYSYADIGAANSTSGWAKYQASFTTPPNTVNMTMFHLINTVGTLTTDDFSLSASTMPSISIVTPSNGSLITGNATLSANATAYDGIASVQFQVDNNNVGSAIQTAPYQMSWNSASVTNGTHYITAIATGNDGNISKSSPIMVNVSNANPSGGNLIPNPLISVVDPNNKNLPLNWTHNAWGTNTETFTYNNSGYNDTNSVTVNMTSYSSGDAKWYFEPQIVQEDTQYKYSEYYKSNVQTQIMAVFSFASSPTLYQFIGLPDTLNSWQYFSTDFSIPLGTTNVTIYHLINSVGYLTTDDFSLSPYTPVGFKRPILTLTFDDGYQSTYDYGLPLLQQYGFQSTQFIITDLINQPGYMTTTEIKNMYQASEEIGSHTISHSDLTQENNSTMNYELKQSQNILEQITGHPVTDMAYPYGLYNNNVVNDVKNYYTGARGVEDALNSKDNFNPYDIRVQNIFINTPNSQIADWIKQAQQTNTWLVLVYHSIDPNTSSPIDGDQYNVTPAQLNTALQTIKSSGITVETMSQALNEIYSQL